MLKETAANLEFFNVKLTFQNENEKVILRKNKTWKVIVRRNKSNCSLEDAHGRKNNPHLTPVSMFKTSQMSLSLSSFDFLTADMPATLILDPLSYPNLWSLCVAWLQADVLSPWCIGIPKLMVRLCLLFHPRLVLAHLVVSSCPESVIHRFYA